MGAHGKKDCAQRLLLTLWILWVHHAHDVHQFTCNSWVRLCLVCDKLALHAFVSFTAKCWQVISPMGDDATFVLHESPSNPSGFSDDL